VLPQCAALDMGLLVFAPLGKGLLTGALQDVTAFGADDLRSRLPRHSGDNLARNQTLVEGLREFAAAIGVSPGQLALVWLLAREPWIVPLPGTRNRRHLAENVRATELHLEPDVVLRLDALVQSWTVTGDRYPTGWRLPRPELDR
jgi:aryl-alcohol dehydrogenase-like predicted oxidoreductase